MTKKKLTLTERLNIVRAGVLGANDGIIGGAGVILGVTGATTNSTVIFVAGLAEMFAVAFSMASGEFVSVSTQKDTERAVVVKAKAALRTNPEQVHQVITAHYQAKGAGLELASGVATDLMHSDALGNYVRIKYGFEVNQFLSPIHALWSSFFASLAGGIWPLLAIILVPQEWKVVGTIIATLWALFLTGWLSAWSGKAPKLPAIARNMLTGIITMAFTYWIGTLLK
ncbi:VIT family protein [Periweissella cryptocerci]|uniref:VIT family protein n=1 Tax=Periweissella cryptocerci TaxID=2506420 RepID=A0A4P6YT60_9LACO|nr:VIT family protein [Periweissella cryptocerci]QBO35924.1 VIT family protein [Periweissella cryptocerci]